MLNEKLSLLLSEEIDCTGCGRTDTGVHARKFFLHFDTEKKLKAAFIDKLNAFLPDDIAAQHLFLAPENASARWDAIERSYLYLITRKKDPFLNEYAAYIYRDIDIKALQKAATLLKEYKTFKALSKASKDEKHFKCNITYSAWKQRGDLLVFKISANRFLRGMVRATVGTMLEIGKDKMSLPEFKKMLREGDRTQAGALVPPQGLYLTDVKYPEGLLKMIK